MKKLLALVIAMITAFACLTACGGGPQVNANFTVTSNDTSNSTMDDNGKGTYTRTLERTVNGNTYKYYIYAASDDQYSPDKAKYDAADMSFAYNTTTGAIEMNTHGLDQNDVDRICNYIHKYAKTYQDAVDLFDKKTEAYLKGEYEDDYDKEGFLDGYNMPDTDIKEMVDGKGYVESAFKRTINGKPVQFYYYASSDDKYNVDKYKESHANVSMFVNLDNGDIHVNCLGIDGIDSDTLRKVVNEVTDECDGVNNCWDIYYDKMTKLIETVTK